MPLREKAKSFFRARSKTTSSVNTNTSSTTAPSLYHASTHDTLASSLSDALSRWPSNVYKPGEAMPRPKYRAIPKPEHTERLAAFRFTDAWASRRNSGVSQYSPMGTRAPSRRNSLDGEGLATATTNTTRANSSLFDEEPASTGSNPSMTSFGTGDVSGASSSSARSCAGVLLATSKTAPDVQHLEHVVAAKVA